jgi:hypothetical protein
MMWLFNPPPSRLPELSKTGQTTPWSGLDGGFVFFFSFFISTESLKNHSKSQKKII